MSRKIYFPGDLGVSKQRFLSSEVGILAFALGMVNWWCVSKPKGNYQQACPSDM